MKKDLEVIINVGPPASGKSTQTKEFLDKNPNYVKVSRDDFRYMLQNKGFCEPKIEKMITDMHNQTILTALGNKCNVIVDNTNLKVSTINEIVNLVHEYADVNFRVFDVPYKTLLERDAARERSVGKDVIDRMWKQWEILKDSFDFQPVKKARFMKPIVPNFNSDLQDCIIMDIDGTLAHSNGKRGFFDLDKVDVDDLNLIVAEQVEFHRNKGRKIIILSGRDETCRDMTKEWLDFYDIKYDDLFMRPKDDISKDKHVKKKIYESEIKDKYNVLAIYEDRLSVLSLWYELGLFAFNVNNGLKIY